MNNKLKGNLSMAVSKTFSGLNENALKYLLPTWMTAYSGILIRLCFGSLFFWVAGLVERKTATRITTKQKIQLLVTGAVCMFSYMFGLLVGLTYTTPISSSIFISTEPIWVFLICVIFYHERVTWLKVIGIALGIGGALMCILTQKSSEIARDPVLGGLICLYGAIAYSAYLVISGRFLKTMDKITVSKWTFLGGLIPAIIAVAIVGWHAPVLSQRIFSTPMLVLAFVLIGPTALSYFLVDIGLKNLSTTVVALYGNVILIVAAIVSYILGQDRFDWIQLFAMLIIIASVYFVEVAESKSTPTTPTKK